MVAVAASGVEALALTGLLEPSSESIGLCGSTLSTPPFYTQSYLHYTYNLDWGNHQNNFGNL